MTIKSEKIAIKIPSKRKIIWKCGKNQESVLQCL